MKRHQAMKTYRAWLAQLPGWRLDLTRGDHVVFQSPRGEKVFLSQTPSDHRAMKNARAQLRRTSGRRIR